MSRAAPIHYSYLLNLINYLVSKKTQKDTGLCLFHNGQSKFINGLIFPLPKPLSNLCAKGQKKHWKYSHFYAVIVIQKLGFATSLHCIVAL